MCNIWIVIRLQKVSIYFINLSFFIMFSCKTIFFPFKKSNLPSYPNGFRKWFRFTYIPMKQTEYKNVSERTYQTHPKILITCEGPRIEKVVASNSRRICMHTTCVMKSLLFGSSVRGFSILMLKTTVLRQTWLANEESSY